MRPRHVVHRPGERIGRNLARSGFRPLYETVTLAKGPRVTESS